MTNQSVMATPPILEKKTSPQQQILKAVLTLIVLVWMTSAIIPSDFNWQTVGDAFQGITAYQYAFLFVLACCVEILKAAPSSVLIDRLSLLKAFISNEASGTISNTVPGPSGTAMRYVIYRSWGLSDAEFGRATVVNSVVNNLVMLVFPIISVILVSTDGTVPGSIWWISAIVALLAIIGFILIVIIARSEKAAHWIGEKTGAFYLWFRGLVKRPTKTDIADALVKFRVETLTVLSHVWKSLLSVTLGRYFMTFAVFLASIRFVGLDSSEVHLAVAFAAYALARLGTMVEITPGGVGVNEVIYIGLLNFATNNQYEELVTAAVLVFRAFTYLLPIVMGAICYVFWSYKRSWRVDKESRKAASVA